MPGSAERSCLVLGGRGFIGAQIVAAAGRRGWRVVPAGRADVASLKGTRWDLLINADGNARRYLADRDPIWDFEASVTSVYRSLFDFKYGEYVLISTVDVYDRPDCEETTKEDTPVNLLALRPYGFHRRLAEMAVMRQAARWWVIRLAQVIGEGSKKGPIHDLLSGSALFVSPESSLHFLTAQRVGELVVALVERTSANAVFNLCGRGSVPFRRVLDMLPPGWPLRWHDRLEIETYRISTARAEAVVELPDSFEEVRSFVSARIGTAREAR